MGQLKAGKDDALVGELVVLDVDCAEQGPVIASALEDTLEAIRVGEDEGRGVPQIRQHGVGQV